MLIFLILLFAQFSLLLLLSVIHKLQTYFKWSFIDYKKLPKLSLPLELRSIKEREQLRVSEKNKHYVLTFR